MDRASIIKELKHQRDRLNHAITALQRGSSISIREPKVKNARRKRRRLSAAARKRISEAAKARWAKAKRAGRKAP